MGKDLCFNEAAQAMEAKLIAFYNEMAKWVKNPKSKELLLFLAREETEHLSSLETWACNEVNTEILNRAFQQSEDVLAFLQKELMGKVTLSIELEDELKIIELAMQAEADMQRFYETLLQHVDDVSLARDVESILREEREHCTKLRALRNMVTQEKKASTPTIDEMRKG